MPFISTYKQAMKLVSQMEKGTCNGSCKTIWKRNLKYALKAKSNPLSLTKKQRQTLAKKLTKTRKANK